MKYDIFISYSRKDADKAQYIQRILESGGYTCFVDIGGISSGDDYLKSIISAIENSSLFLCLTSTNYTGSTFSTTETLFAGQKHKPILPITLDDAELPMSLRLMLFDYQYIDFNSPDFENRLLHGVGQILGFDKIETLTEEQRKRNLEAAEKRRNGDDNYEPRQIDVDIFISYRRVDGRDYARNIMQGLKIAGYPKVFFDFHHLRDGVFNTQILDAIYSCKDFILVITPLALKNCSRKGDWVTKEIRAALKYNKKIIPIVIEDTFKDWPTDFPEDLSPIKNIHFHKLLTDEYFEDSIVRLAKRLTTEVSTDYVNIDDFQAIQPVHNATVYYKLKVNRDCRLYIDEEEIQELKAGQLLKIPLPKGEYIRRVVDVENDQIFNEITLVMEHDKAEIISLATQQCFLKRIFKFG